MPVLPGASSDRSASNAWKPARWLAGALALLLVGSFAACKRSSPSPQVPPRVVVVGLDAGTWNLLDGYIDRGLLPNLAKLRSEGTYGSITSTRFDSSPVIWTTVATGKNPEKHGIDWFVVFRDGVEAMAPVNSSMRKVKAFWNILTSARIEMAVIGWFVTWPVEPITSLMVSDRAHWGTVSDATFPPTYEAQLPTADREEAARAIGDFMDADYDPERADREGDDEEERLNFLIFDRFVRAYTRDLFYFRAAQKALASGPLPQVLALYLRGTDDVQHGFWKYMDPEPYEEEISEARRVALGKIIERYWQWTDARLGDILANYDLENTLVVVVSDHGAGPAVGEYAVNGAENLHLSGAHRPDGIFIARGPGVRRGDTIENVRAADITPTMLHYLGQAVGADMDGRVLEEMFEGAMAARPIRTVPTYEDAESAAAKPVVEGDQKADAEILGHLRSLGYID